MKKKHNTLIWFNIITIFPDMFRAVTEDGIVGRAIKKKIININFLNLRNFSQNKYKSVDNRPYGGGPGMLMSVEPLYLAIKEAKSRLKNSTVIYLSPQGKTFQQHHIKEFIIKKKLFLYVVDMKE